MGSPKTNVDDTNSHSQIQSSIKWERILAILGLIILIIAWIIGSFRAEAELLPFLEQTLPEASSFESAGNGTYTARGDEPDQTIMGYVTTGSAHGYGGELKTAVAVAGDGSVLSVTIIRQSETGSFLRRIMRKNFLQALVGKKYSEGFELGEDLEGVTGATYTCHALSDAVRKASRKIASENLGYAPIPESSTPIQFGLPDVVLILLFLIGLLGRHHRFPYKKIIRWISVLTGMIVLGFIYNKPLTLTIINKMLLGFWPEWQFHIYWYILLAGIFLIYTKDNKNPYCEWFCPFGGVQECLSLIGGAKKRIPRKIHRSLRWFQRFLALSAIALALIYRNPSISSYEVFGAFFQLIGTNFQFALLGVVLITALFLKRPWCNYLCPLRPVTDFIRLIRNWLKEVIERAKPRQATRGKEWEMVE